jgi:hypothetical protein
MAHELAGIARLSILESMLLTPSFKHETFKDEGEVRLQVLHAPETGVSKQLQFRDGVMGLTPYVAIPLHNPDLPTVPAIREIVVGPQPNQAEAIRAVKLLVARHELDAQVNPSDIPLRP